MEVILVISDEPALALVLADELPQYRITPLKLEQTIPAQLKEVRLVVTEKAGNDSIRIGDKEVAALQVARPVRLRDVLYNIEARLQAQSPANLEKIAIFTRHSYLPRERMLVEADAVSGVSLTEKEGELLLALLDAPQGVPKEDLLRDVWGYSEQADTHTLETHIYRLRGKLKQLDAAYDITTSGEGYKIISQD